MRRVFALLGLVPACLSPTGGLPLETGETGEGLSAGSTSVVVTATTSTSATTSTTSTATAVGTSSSEGGSEAETLSFLVTPDGGWLGDQCDVVEQNCPEGQKCTWSGSGGGWFERMVCVPLADHPRPVGAACTYNPDDLDGIDDCAMGSICLDLSGGSGTGICTQMCAWEALECPKDMVCMSSRTVSWCEPACDLLAQDCPEGQRCDIDGWAPLCAQDWPEEHPQHGVGEACDYAAQCDIGATCVAQATIECEFNCCTPFCERGKAGCPLPAQGCIEPYEGWDDETGWDEVGVCRVVNP